MIAYSIQFFSQTWFLNVISAIRHLKNVNLEDMFEVYMKNRYINAAFV